MILKTTGTVQRILHLTIYMYGMAIDNNSSLADLFLFVYFIYQHRSHSIFHFYDIFSRQQKLCQETVLKPYVCRYDPMAAH